MKMAPHEIVLSFRDLGTTQIQLTTLGNILMMTLQLEHL